MSASIGASMLEYMSAEPSAAKDLTTTCLVHALLPPQRRRQDDNVFIQGPHATSLVMDLAHSVASRHEPVLFLTCANKDATFPLFCYPTSSNSNMRDDDTSNLQTKLRHIDDSTTPTITTTWSQRALKRITVVHFRSSRDLMTHLLKLNPIMKYGVIIVDGVDLFVKQDSVTTATTTISMSPEETMEMVQIFAIAADTARALKQTIVTTTAMNLAPHVERIVSNWYPRVLCMKQIPIDQSCSKLEMEGDSIESSWKVNENLSHNSSGIVFSAMERKADGASVIVWSPPQGELIN